jgi:predicted DNA binding protein
MPTENRPSNTEQIEELFGERFIPFTPKQLIQLKASYEAGETTEQLGKRYGISKSAVRRRLIDLGVTFRRKGKVLLVTDAVKRKASTMRRRGVKWKEVGEKLGVNHQSIQAALSRSMKA